jgi:hypothetical protein
MQTLQGIKTTQRIQKTYTAPEVELWGAADILLSIPVAKGQVVSEVRIYTSADMDTGTETLTFDVGFPIHDEYVTVTGGATATSVSAVIDHFLAATTAVAAYASGTDYVASTTRGYTFLGETSVQLTSKAISATGAAGTVFFEIDSYTVEV